MWFIYSILYIQRPACKPTSVHRENERTLKRPQVERKHANFARIEGRFTIVATALPRK